MKYISFLFLFFVSYSFSQEMKDIDKLSIDICNSINKSKEKEDSIKIQNAFSENFSPFAENLSYQI